LIERIELKNFESHEHTVIEDLSGGLNLICGLSNSGKTSIIRALKLVAYNEFDPRAVRAGAKDCEVTVTTHRGTVKVTKGKSNDWEVTPKGQPTQYFSKIGKVILKEAAEIVGLGMVRLGDVEMPVNVMNQLEGHFMLTELNGKNATGSVRAQVIDEISGLSGIEGLIKGVSLDNHRWGREIKVLEDRMEEVRGGMHDAGELASERKLMDEVKARLDERDECLQATSELGAIRADAGSEQKSMADLALTLAGLPDVAAAGLVADMVGETVEKLTEMDRLAGEWLAEAEPAGEVEKELGAMGDIVGAREKAKAAGAAAERSRGMATVLRGWESERDQAAGAERDLDSMGDADQAAVLADQAEGMFDRAWRMGKMREKLLAARKAVRGMGDQMDAASADLVEAHREHNELLRSFKVCPLSLMPISKKCVEGMKIPVVENDV
jgi:DNA repair exonuclease SbcCD ATPase subunit